MGTPYMTAAQLATLTGRTFDAADQSYIDTVLAPAATTRIDQYLGRSWQSPTIVGERVRVYGTRARLTCIPVLSIEALVAPSLWAGSADYPLVEGTNYTLRDARSGLLYIWTPQYSLYDDGCWMRADYTIDDTIPTAVTLAMQHYLLRLLDTAGSGSTEVPAGPITSETVENLTTSYASMYPKLPEGSEDFSAPELALLRPYRFLQVVAA